MSASPEATAVPRTRKPFRWLRRLYDWTLSWADSRFGPVALFVLAFVEASFFPIPPDVLLIALALGRPDRALQHATICTIGSVMGAVLGWSIGIGLWTSLGTAEACPEYGGGAMLFDSVPGFTCHAFGKVQDAYATNAWIALFAAAFTPIPYKVFTIAAGVFGIPLLTLIAASVVGRGARFALVGLLIRVFGPQVKEFIEKRFELMTVTFTVLLVGGFVLIKYVL